MTTAPADTPPHVWWSPFVGLLVTVQGGRARFLTTNWHKPVNLPEDAVQLVAVGVPHSAVPDGVWGCRNFPQEGMPCVQVGSPYTELAAAARSYHTGGVHACLGDGSVRFFSDNIDLTLWQNLGSRGGGEVLGDF